jgi:hypothetical protein
MTETVRDLELRACTHKTRRATRPLFPQKLTFYAAICIRFAP